MLVVGSAVWWIVAVTAVTVHGWVVRRRWWLLGLVTLLHGWVTFLPVCCALYALLTTLPTLLLEQPPSVPQLLGLPALLGFALLYLLILYWGFCPDPEVAQRSGLLDFQNLLLHTAAAAFGLPVFTALFLPARYAIVVNLFLTYSTLTGLFLTDLLLTILYTLTHLSAKAVTKPKTDS